MGVKKLYNGQQKKRQAKSDLPNQLRYIFFSRSSPLYNPWTQLPTTM